MKKKFKKRKEKIELNVPYNLLQYYPDGKHVNIVGVKILLLDGEKRVVFDNGSESISLYEVKGDLVKRKSA